VAARGKQKHDAHASGEKREARPAGHGLWRAGDRERRARPRGGEFRDARVNEDADVIGELDVGEMEGAELGEIFGSGAIAAGGACETPRFAAKPGEHRIAR
jgi:hypothetical protein